MAATVATETGAQALSGAFAIEKDENLYRPEG